VGVLGYQSLGLLGQGASGQVFKARQHSTGQFVAIKIPSPTAPQDPAARRRVHQRLHQETRVLAMLQHAHVVRLIDKGMATGGQLFAVLEYVPGQTLRDFLRQNGRLSLGQALALMVQVLDALAFLHSHDIVHRDLKPENIMVVPSGTALHVKMLDFGLASHRGEPIFAQGAEGTPAYCAPEQLRGELCVPATDIYAWALVFAECLSARPCVPGANSAEILHNQLSTQPLAALLQQALQKDVRLRTADAVGLYGALHGSQPPLHSMQTMPAMPPRHGTAGGSHHTTLDSVHTDPSAVSDGLALVVLCLAMHLYPAGNASLALTDLQAIRDQHMQWCANAVQSGHGQPAGLLGDYMLFHFAQDTNDAHWLHQIALLALDLCARAQRRSHTLDIQHGVRLDLSGAIHTATLRSHNDPSAIHQADNLALHVNSRAGAGAVLLSHQAQSALAGGLPTEPYMDAAAAPHAEPVYKLVEPNNG
jgi:tRNA A-37 threonylcarbamoyl transferase component Bud32